MELDTRRKSARKAAKPIAPFHWEIEFPEVFALDAMARRHAGFDAIVGNPPFAGKNTLIEGNAEGYIDWLKQLHPESHGNADVVAHFYRRAFSLLKPGGCFGLIATNTIGQGDTRSTGLRWICTHGGTIYRARKRMQWPGEAAVVVSVAHVCHGPMPGPYWLDRRRVDLITAYLFHAGGHEDPAKLKANERKSFQGSIVLGMGFTFDDTDIKGVASPLSEMHRLIARDPRNAERIFPYLGGEEVNDSPTHAHHRYVINFEDFPLCREELSPSWAEAADDQRENYLRQGRVPLDYIEPVAADWPELLAIVEAKVKPERDHNDREIRRRFWWKFGERAPALNRALSAMNRTLAVSRIANALAFTFLPTAWITNEKIVVVTFEGYSVFACLQCRLHALWARFFSSTLKDDLQYTPSDCFESFAFPELPIELDRIGHSYYGFRADLMHQNNEGLTKTYNRFHNPEDRSPGIVRLRELHAEMDHAVLDAYGWQDLQPSCDFYPEFDEEEEEEDEDDSRTRRKKYRYRWPEEIRDEILARLLALNAERAAAEVQPATTPKPRKRKAVKAPTLF